jgi:hypothetical protein
MLVKIIAVPQCFDLFLTVVFEEKTVHTPSTLLHIAPRSTKTNGNSATQETDTVSAPRSAYM